VRLSVGRPHTYDVSMPDAALGNDVVCERLRLRAAAFEHRHLQARCGQGAGLVIRHGSHPPAVGREHRSNVCNSHGATYTRNGPSTAHNILAEAILRQLHGDRAFDNSSASATLSTERRRGQRGTGERRSAAERAHSTKRSGANA